MGTLKYATKRQPQPSRIGRALLRGLPFPGWLALGMSLAIGISTGFTRPALAQSGAPSQANDPFAPQPAPGGSPGSGFVPPPLPAASQGGLPPSGTVPRGGSGGALPPGAFQPLPPPPSASGGLPQAGLGGLAPATGAGQTTAEAALARQQQLEAEAAREAAEALQQAEAAARERQEAFDQASSSIYPLTPEEIEEFARRADRAQRAARLPYPGPQPRPRVRSETISLDPGAQPPMIYVEPGYVSTVTFLDATGQPWPIVDVAVGGPFNVPQLDENSHVLRISPEARHATGNLSLRMTGLASPLTFLIGSGGGQVDFRFDVRIPEFGPNADAPLIARGEVISSGDAMMMMVLDGVPPSEARSWKILGVDTRTRVWKIDQKIYVRTPLTLLSPGWDSSVRSADGTNVYVLQESPVLLLSDNGTMMRARLERPADTAFAEAAVGGPSVGGLPKAARAPRDIPKPKPARRARAAADNNNPPITNPNLPFSGSGPVIDFGTPGGSGQAPIQISPEEAPVLPMGGRR